MVAGASGQCRVGVVEAGLQPVEVTGHHACPTGHDAQHRAASYDRARQGPDPAEQQAVLSRPADLGQRLLDQVGGSREVLGHQGVPDRVGGQTA